MRYSEMTPRQRQLILGNPANYPLKVTVGRKSGLLSLDAIDLLRRQGVDFDVDDGQARRLLAEAETAPDAGAGLPVPPPAAGEGTAPPPPVRPLFGRPSPLLLGLAAAAGVMIFLRRILPWRR